MTDTTDADGRDDQLEEMLSRLDRIIEEMDAIDWEAAPLISTAEAEILRKRFDVVRGEILDEQIAAFEATNDTEEDR